MLKNPVFIAMVIVASMAIGYVVLSFLPPVLYRRMADASMKRHCRGRLVLTYDDGPGTVLTPPLLQLLSKHHARASFYLVGFRAERFPAMADEIVQAGHDLGCHTQWHRNAWKLTPWRGVREVAEGYRTMSRWFGARAPFRPPFGKLTTWTWLALARRGAPICWWTCDAGDTAATLPHPDSIVRKIVNDGGGVVLMHSHDRGSDRHEYVLDVTGRLIAAAHAHHLRIITMTELLQSGRVAAGVNADGSSIAGASRA